MPATGENSTALGNHLLVCHLPVVKMEHLTVHQVQVFRAAHQEQGPVITKAKGWVDPASNPL